MFGNVKKLVEKASISKKPGGSFDGLKASDVDPHLVFHYGIPLGCCMFAYDSIQKILAISTVDGRIKLFGKDNSQALLESDDTVPSKFLEFVQNQGILINVNFKNHIEVWNLEKRLLSDVHVLKEEITSFAVMQTGPYMYVGDSDGNIKVFKIEQEVCHVIQMKYTIPFSASHGNPTEVLADRAVISVLPQPTAESKRILVIFRDGFMILWEIRESKAILVTGGSMFQSVHNEAKHVTSACWVCPFGSKVAVGYNNGEVLIWSVPTSKQSGIGIQNAPICKLILGFKSEKTPIASLKWAYADAKASRIYVMGASDVPSSLLQVILLNEHTETRTIKLGLHLSEPCVDMAITSSTTEQSKKQDFLLLIGKSGNIYMYDDCFIEKYLLQCQSRSPPSLPKEVTVKLPFLDSSITVTKLITENPCAVSSDEDYIQVVKDIPSLVPLETKSKDGGHSNSYQFSGFGKIKNLYITGHSDGAINFWDLSCSFPIPVLSLKQQSEDDFSLSGIPLTALYFDGNSLTLVSGDQSGTVRIFKFKPEPYTADNSFISFQGSTKKRNNHIIHSVKVIKVNGSVLSLAICQKTGHLAVGSDRGDVSLVDTEGLNIIFQSHIASDICPGIISMQFKTCSLQNFEKNVLVVATKDSSVLAFDSDSGSMLSTSMVQPKKPSKALFMQILDWQDILVRGANISIGSPVEEGIPKQSFILVCSEKAAYVYSLNQTIQGVKKVHYKKKFHSTSCCWASTFYTASDVGLILIFTSGKVEIRSLPELSLLKETSIRGFRYSAPKPNSLSDSSICSSNSGDFVMVNGDQEFFIFSVLLQKDIFRNLDFISRVYRKDLVLTQEVLASGATVQKEKKKGIFGSVLKDIKGSKKHAPEMETEDTRESIEELSTIFSIANFPCEVENKDSQTADEDEMDLNIDDIDIDDPGEKPKEQNILAAFNKHKLKFQAFTAGKLKQMKVKNEKTTPKEEPQDEKSSAVDQIKKKYGFSLQNESSAARMAESKLQDNVRKLQGISLKTAEMQDTAKSFSSMARELLRSKEQEDK
ncbi:DUO1-activated WD40 1, Tomosyn-like [Hibiscus trionum]|uniref:DUO1-activated WD40 1, Tomosyn-like n=1 Tax=Hibiscus trionum TaxID=183268 RepID=A0A9W7H0Q5_HIBTR|nr:DUO1-activated WD40 1, Tomosyn-like [Hibiscus trionum]